MSLIAQRNADDEARSEELMEALSSDTDPSLEGSFRKELVVPESSEGNMGTTSEPAPYMGTKLEPATLTVAADEELRNITWRRLMHAAQRSLRTHGPQLTSLLDTADPHEKALGSTLPRIVVNVEDMHHKTFPMLDSDMDLFEACQKTLGESGGTTSSVGLRPNRGVLQSLAPPDGKTVASATDQLLDWARDQSTEDKGQD